MEEKMEKDDMQVKEDVTAETVTNANDEVGEVVADEQSSDCANDAANSSSVNEEQEPEIEEVNVMDEETGENVNFKVSNKKPVNKDASEINEVNVKATVSSQEYYEAHVNHIFYRRGIIKAAFVFALVIIFDVVIRYFVPGLEVTTGQYILVIITALVMSIGLPFLLKSQIGKAYDRNIFYSKYTRYSINNKYVAVASKSRGKKISWDKFKFIKQTTDFFIFAVDGTHAIVLPIRVLSGIQVQAIRNLILKNTSDNKKIKVKLP